MQVTSDCGTSPLHTYRTLGTFLKWVQEQSFAPNTLHFLINGKSTLLSLLKLQFAFFCLKHPTSDQAFKSEHLFHLLKCHRNRLQQQRGVLQILIMAAKALLRHT
jgi:hypothetical protein